MSDDTGRRTSALQGGEYVSDAFAANRRNYGN